MFDLINNMIMRLRNFVFPARTKKITWDMSDLDFLEREIDRWKNSPERAMQIKGALYYENEHDIIHRKRTVIGENGELETVDNLPNNRVIDNQYAKMVKQKTNYLLGKPFSVDCDDDQYAEKLKVIFDNKFMKTLNSSAKYAYNCGLSWLYPYYSEDGSLQFRLFPAYEILPFWRDNEHTVLDMAVRLYQVVGYRGSTPEMIEKVEVYAREGVKRYTLQNGKLKPDGEAESYILAPAVEGQVSDYNWDRIPLIPIKANETETPLLKKVKSLQDGINVMLSDFENNMQEDCRNTILVLKNYDGENLGEFRKNLATYGAVKVRYDGDTKGGVETLEVSVNADNYKVIIEIFKKALIENAMGYDAKDDRLAGNPNQMNIKSMYSDIDLDANEMETEYQSAFDDILWFVDAYLSNAGEGNYFNQDVTIKFNRDILINENEAIENCKNSVGILSDETIITNHPWVSDPLDEMEKIAEQEQKEQEEMKKQYNPFGEGPHGQDGEGDVNAGQ